MDKLSAGAEGEARKNIQVQISQLRSQLSQVESDVRHSQNEMSELKERISQLQQKSSKARDEKSKCEDELRTAERLLDRLRNKHERMTTALAKLNDNMNTMLSASKSFETRAVSKTEQSVGSIDKCIAAIDAYLG